MKALFLDEIHRDYKRSGSLVGCGYKPQEVIFMNCPRCNSFRLDKYGWRVNKRGSFQKHKCKDCKKQFIDDDFLHMQTPKQAVAFALRMKTKSKLSAELIMEEIEKIFGIKRCATSIYYWIKKFSKLFDLLDKIPLRNISPRLHMDHTQVKINGETFYLWACKCPKTKLIVGWYLSPTKDLRNAIMFIWNTKRKLLPTHQLLETVSDGEQTFRRAVIEVFGHSVKHYCYHGFKDKKNNNTIERFFRLKDNLPQFRSVEQANNFFKRFIVMYNLKKAAFLTQTIEFVRLNETIKILPNFFIQVL